MANGNKVNANPGNWSQFHVPGLVGGQEGFLEEDDSDVLACCHVEDIPSPLVGRSEIGLPDIKIGIGNSPRSWIWFDALFSQVLPVSFHALILVTSIVGLLRAAATPLVRAVLQELLALWWGCFAPGALLRLRFLAGVGMNVVLLMLAPPRRRASLFLAFASLQASRCCFKACCSAHRKRCAERLVFWICCYSSQRVLGALVEGLDELRSQAQLFF